MVNFSCLTTIPSHNCKGQTFTYVQAISTSLDVVGMLGSFMDGSFDQHSSKLLGLHGFPLNVPFKVPYTGVVVLLLTSSPRTLTAV